jgi:hypothetical protein
MPLTRRYSFPLAKNKSRLKLLGSYVRGSGVNSSPLWAALELSTRSVALPEGIAYVNPSESSLLAPLSSSSFCGTTPYSGLPTFKQKLHSQSISTKSGQTQFGSDTTKLSDLQQILTFHAPMQLWCGSDNLSEIKYLRRILFHVDASVLRNWELSNQI